MKSKASKHDKNDNKEDGEDEDAIKCPPGQFPRKSTGKCISNVVTPESLNLAYGILDNTGLPEASQGWFT